MSDPVEAAQSRPSTPPLATVATVASGVAGGLVGWWSQIPAGPLLGSVVVVGAIGLVRDVPIEVPRQMRVVSRLLIGSVIGSIVTAELLASLGGMAIWAVVFTASMIGVGLVCSWIIVRTSPLDARTAVIACAPGGMAEMSALADDLGARADIVLAIQLFRKLAALGMAVAVLMLFTST